MTGQASAQDLSRADPSLRFLWMRRAALADPVPPDPRPPLALRADGLTVAPASLLAASVAGGAGGPWVRVLARLGTGGEAALQRSGAVVGARVGDIVTARIPLDALDLLLAEPSVRALEAATALRPLGWPPSGSTADSAPTPAAANDSAASDARFDELRRRVGDGWEGLAGQGVIVGIYDSGLDLTHDDFLRPDGSTRVLYAWDQTVEGAAPGAVGPHTFSYGTECLPASVEGGDCPMVDRVGHGTHVAGTAVGDGSATGQGMPAYRYPGGAPAADVIVVKGGDGSFTADRLLDGVAYILERAAALGRPAVVNVSLSSQSGPHDGTTLLEQGLDALVGPGRIIVAGSGNAGDHRNTRPLAPNGPSHAMGLGGSGSHVVRIPAYEPTPGPANDGVIVELWYDGADSLAVTVRTPSGSAVTVATGDSATLATSVGTVAIMNAVGGPSPLNGDHSVLMAIADGDAASPPQPGDWEIEVSPVAVHADGSYHVWLTGYALDAFELPVLEGGTVNRYLVGVPASADRILAVGAHVTRHDWPGPDGEIRTFPFEEQLGDIAYFSSPGPRRDGVLKPDLTAPGKVLVSSRSKDAALWDPFPWLVEADSVHAALLGTSMSSPQAAAAVALLLQIEPDLTPADARDLLRLGAATDAFVPADRPHPVWGSGKLDAAEAAERLRPDGLAGPTVAVNLSANPVRGDALVINYPEPPRSIAVYTLVAERVRGFDESEIGPLSTIWGLDTDAGGAVANGVYVLVVELPDRRVIRKLFVARP
jgi:hypothetical protein